VSGKALGTCAGVLAAVGFYVLPPFSHHDETAPDLSSSAAIAARLRDDALRRARTRIGDFNRDALVAEPRDPKGVLTRDEVSCTFVPHAPGGTSLKFDCALDDGEIIRVKYGHQPEIHAEVAATRLLTALGYAADRVYMVQRLHCRGCPMHPFVTMLLRDAIGAPAKDADGASIAGQRDFQWVSVERKFEGAPIEDETRQGWAWWELKNVHAPRVELDALRLIAVFLAHWDNKAENQRLVCLTPGWRVGMRCRDSFLLLQDVGSTFGPTRVDLDAWEDAMMWSDRSTCTISMREMPYKGGTFGTVRIGERGRRFLASMLDQLSDQQITDLFTGARFDKQSGLLSDPSPVSEWVRVFKQRRQAISDGVSCPEA